MRPIVNLRMCKIVLLAGLLLAGCSSSKPKWRPEMRTYFNNDTSPAPSLLPGNRGADADFSRNPRKGLDKISAADLGVPAAAPIAPPLAGEVAAHEDFSAIPVLERVERRTALTRPLPRPPDRLLALR